MIYFFGDTHGHFRHVLEIVSQDRPAAIVFLGDLQAQRPLDAELEYILGMTEVWFIHGNHDTDSDADYDHLFGSALADRNLHGRVALVSGVMHPEGRWAMIDLVETEIHRCMGQVVARMA